jgi:hypothetical protein
VFQTWQAGAATGCLLLLLLCNYFPKATAAAAVMAPTHRELKATIYLLTHPCDWCSNDGSHLFLRLLALSCLLLPWIPGVQIPSEIDLLHISVLCLLLLLLLVLEYCNRH